MARQKGQQAAQAQGLLLPAGRAAAEGQASKALTWYPSKESRARKALIPEAMLRSRSAPAPPIRMYTRRGQGALSSKLSGGCPCCSSPSSCPAQPPALSVTPAACRPSKDKLH